MKIFKIHCTKMCINCQFQIKGNFEVHEISEKFKLTKITQVSRKSFGTILKIRSEMNK